MKARFLLAVCALFASAYPAQSAEEERSSVAPVDCAALPDGIEGTLKGRRVVCADVAAFDQMLVYNRFGSYNPFGMVFGLRGDLMPANVPPSSTRAEHCDDEDGTDKTFDPSALTPGNVRFKDCKRPRPLVLRANEKDLLHLRVTNYLHPGQPEHSETFCRQKDTPEGTFGRQVRNVVSEGDAPRVAHGEAACLEGSKEQEARYASDPEAADWPKTRGLNFAIQGLIAVPSPFAPDAEESLADLQVCQGTRSIEPGEHADCFYEIDRTGTYFLSSNAAPAGGEGFGGSITHGLFGAVVVEDTGTSWYRSQVSREAFDLAWDRASNGVRHARDGEVDYEKKVGDVPVLNMAAPRNGGSIESGPVEIVHSDLNAVVHSPAIPPQDGKPGRDEISFREFSVFFHDELKSFYTRNFEELGQMGQFAGVRDGFGINYGASGMGTLLLANRKNIGPSRDCVECLYEEFFLTSWANGDPALLERYVDDPSNVHHSYLNDEIKFRNFHAGPKETHVFHLHAHQWFAGNDGNRGSYLDSQTVAPQQGFTYDIYRGGLKDLATGEAKGWWDSKGAGNRNRTPGDSIFHCHLYPHFAQGMWELWRAHDVLEDGTRRLPDGQAGEGLSVEESFGPVKRRPGSVDLKTGRWIENAPGTPIPGLVPLKGRPAPILPTYAGETAEAGLTADGKASMPGYPYYIAGEPGHRPPQAPMDIARSLKDQGSVIEKGEHLDGGLPRHTVKDGSEREFSVSGAERIDPGATPDGRRKREKQQSQLVAKMMALGDVTAHITSARLDELLPYDGTVLERNAMGFHHDGKQWKEGGANPAGPDIAVDVRKTDGGPAPFRDDMGGYEVGADDKVFPVNGAPPKPGAPFADPCGMPKAFAPIGAETDPFVEGLFAYPAGFTFGADPKVSGFRRYEASAVQLDLITNRAGWHDPQGRINVLTADSDRYKTNNSGLANPISPYVSAREEPFFFRALSGECIEFRHTNELPKDLELDDFQVRTPTDTIGQHIHLVKFDVTSSDGSGNGWNYEDGTMAPDEVAARICAARTAGHTIVPSRSANQLALTAEDGFCVAKTKDGQPVTTADGRQVYEPAEKDIWKSKRSEHPQRFQTTVQRWFADPILSDDGEGGKVDRTLRTVFTHDHFGPSSIQQHGFYSALVIEPAESRVCKPDKAGSSAECSPFRENRDLAEGLPVLTGAKRVVLMKQASGTPSAEGTEDVSPKPAYHRDYREFALAVADFSTLYDPRDTSSRAATQRAISGEGGAAAIESLHGMARLACEGRWLRSPVQLRDRCGSGFENDGVGWFGAEEDLVPAWHAAGRRGDSPHNGDLIAMMEPGEWRVVADHLLDYRQKAALSNSTSRLASPVNPPARPESISVDHHDPYLVNYRGEPVPLRVGTRESGESSDCALRDLPEQGTVASGSEDAALVSNAGRCSVAVQRQGERGDMSNVFLSSLHGDPATPLLETYSGERTMVRLIQGAQEVQHMMNIEGYTWKRNIDQAFPQAARLIGEDQPEPTLRRVCDRLDAARKGMPLRYENYFENGPSAFGPATPEFAFFSDFKTRAAECPNIEGNVTAQEIGISEHFEFRGAFRQSVSMGALMMARPQGLRSDEAGDDAADRRRFSTDYLYDFGTLDSLWNGAWGNLRVYRDKDAADYARCMREPGSTPATCNASGPRIGARMPTIEDLKSTLPLAIRREPRVSTQIVGCPAESDKVRAAVAAIEARKLFGPDGMAYGDDVHDPDGLLLAAIDPDKVEEGMSREAAEALVRESVGPSAEPYVLRVKAGDCVNLTVVNLLEPEAGQTGLADGLGDARMPAITKLNVDPAYGRGNVINGSESYVLDVSKADRRKHDVRPSARLALRFPLPTLNNTQEIALPFGYNATGALAPAGDTVSFEDAPVAPDGGYVRRTASAETVTFYAGKAWLRGEEPATLAFNVARGFKSKVERAVRSNPGLIPADIARFAAAPQLRAKRIPREELRIDGFDLLGDTYDLTIEQQSLVEAIRVLPGATAKERTDATLRLQDLWAEAAREELADRTHWMPYAFGPMAIKSFGDAIGHGAHGLVGAIDVVPSNWPVAEAGFGRVPDGDNFRIVPQPIAGGQGVVVDDVKLTDHPDGHRIREFVLFYQDGLNLRDRRSQGHWHYDNDLTNVRDPDGSMINPLPDCMVCDDSYDLGDQGVSYHSSPFFSRLRSDSPGSALEADTDLNKMLFPSGFFRLKPEEQAAGADGLIASKSDAPMAVLRAEAGEEVTIGVLQPSGRARQHAFVTIAQGYDDLFPGFGFPHSALMSAGKGLSASLYRPVRAGCYFWHDGPTYLSAGGIWGLLDVVEKGDFGDPSKTSCRRPAVQTTAETGQ